VTAPLCDIFSLIFLVQCLDLLVYKVEGLRVCDHVSLCLMNQEDNKYDNNKAFHVFKPAVAYGK